MGKPKFISLVYPLLLLALILLFINSCHADKKKVHIVYMGEVPRGDISIASMHHSMLKNVLGSNAIAKESLVYSYGNGFNGFAAKLTDEEAARFSEMEGVVSVIPNHKLKPHTTRSWDFMGFSHSKVGQAQQADVVIGVIDTGIWPESASFNDTGFSSPPAKWKGTCQGENFTCNNKLIGGRFYNSDGTYDPTDFKSPRDSIGHGTHTSSTAAGVETPASYFGLADGTARGGVPNSRIAMYKVCWVLGCSVADILKAFDDAIADGVDIISVSLGFDEPLEYFEDPIAIGSFHAMRNGILTSNSAGNSGPYAFSVSNYAPWSLTVAASTIDRKFIAKAVTGNGQIFNGLSVNNFVLNGSQYPLIWGGDAVNISVGSNADISRNCVPNSINTDKVAGKIVLCESFWGALSVHEAGGAGTIITDPDNPDLAFNFGFPVTSVTPSDIEEIKDYIKATENPIATILYGETPKDVMAPYVISFSSRGPNPITPDILKPDLTAPGVDIIAAWSPVAPPSFDEQDTRSVKFNIISGTSMSCPHASGAAAYVKAANPNWSPAAIKSALMTTAYPLDGKKNNDLEFSYGSGHINPAKAIDPGLVYDTSEDDYINFLCKQGYNTTMVRLVTGNSSTICRSSEPGRAWDLNYPSFSVAVEDGQPINAIFTRTVTNVGSSKATYEASWYSPSISISVSVEPQALAFSYIGEKKSYTVKVSGPAISQQPIISGAILWSDGNHLVRSPLVLYNVLPGSIVPTFSSTKKYPKFQGVTKYRKNTAFDRRN
ncbi:hypothetical protein ACFE04_012580 [Oxalis oulophora]